MFLERADRGQVDPPVPFFERRAALPPTVGMRFLFRADPLDVNGGWMLLIMQTGPYGRKEATALYLKAQTKLPLALVRR